jgi:hypothetical protein
VVGVVHSPALGQNLVAGFDASPIGPAQMMRICMTTIAAGV